LSSSINVWLLYSTLRKRGQFEPDQRLRRRTVRLAGAALLMGVTLYFLNDQFTPYTTGIAWQRWAAMAVLVATGGLVYAIACLGLRAYLPSDLMAA
ncbi:polysaccharide biosynthesis C-terminal domain-containing protein, partial [Klebsiella pneumoniae]